MVTFSNQFRAMLRLALLCIVAAAVAAVAAVAADQNTAVASDVDACKGEPGELGESALVQLGTAAQKGIGGATEAIEANSTSNEKSSDESTSSRRRRSRRRRSRRRAGTYTGTIPYKVQVLGTPKARKKPGWP